MRGVKDCVVCGKDHLAQQRRSKEKICAAIEHLKEIHPTTLLTVEDLSSIYQIDETDEEEQITEEFDEQVQWDQENNESDVFIAALKELKSNSISDVSIRAWAWLGVRRKWALF